MRIFLKSVSDSRNISTLAALDKKTVIRCYAAVLIFSFVPLFTFCYFLETKLLRNLLPQERTAEIINGSLILNGGAAFEEPTPTRGDGKTVYDPVFNITRENKKIDGPVNMIIGPNRIVYGEKRNGKRKNQSIMLLTNNARTAPKLVKEMTERDFASLGITIHLLGKARNMALRLLFFLGVCNVLGAMFWLSILGLFIRRREPHNFRAAAAYALGARIFFSVFAVTIFLTLAAGFMPVFGASAKYVLTFIAIFMPITFASGALKTLPEKDLSNG